MPVEIRELVIRAVATLDREDTEDTAGSEGTGLSHGDLTAGSEEIVQECVRQVLRILRKEKDR